MKINKLILNGDKYKRTIQFNDGLTIISGEKTSGKSLILTLINYCLGSSSKIPEKVQYQLFANVKDVYLEILLAGKWLTIKRSLFIQKDKFEVYHCRFDDRNEYMPERLGRSEFFELLMNGLGTIAIKKSKNKAHTDEYTSESISFRDMFRYCYVSQDDLGSKSFLGHLETFKRNKNPYAFEMITDLVDRSHNDLEQQIVDLKNKLSNKKVNYNGLEIYLNQKGIIDRTNTLQKLKAIKGSIKSLQQKQLHLLNTTSSKKNEKDSRVNILLDDIRNLEVQIDSIEKKRTQIELSIQSSQVLLNDYKQELDDLSTTQHVNYELTLKDQKLICPLCQSVLENKDQNEAHTNNVSSVINHVNQKIKLINKKMISENNQRNEFIVQIDSLETRKNVLDEILSDINKKQLLPTLSDWEFINQKLISDTKIKESIDESIRVFHQQDQLQKDTNKIKNEISDLENSMKESKGQNDKSKVKILNSINEKYKELLRYMNYDTLVGTKIDDNSYIPFFESSSVYDHQSGGLRECIQLAYILSIAQSEYTKFFPGLLMLDSIGKYVGTNEATNAELDSERNEDPEVYKEIFRQFISTQKNVQIIVVENTPPDMVKRYVRYQFKNGPHGLIDLDNNEK